MIQDFLNNEGLTDIDCDICIVGGGAIGLSIALEYLDSKISVVLLEGGGLSSEKETQKLYETENKGLPHNNFTGRIRIFGGTTTKWAGQASPLDNIDFEQRDWVPHSGWPIKKSDIEPYFKRAEDIMKIPHVTYDERSWPLKIELPKLESEKFQYVYSQFSPQANFSKAYKDVLMKSKNIRVLLHANAIHVDLKSDKKSVEAIQFKNLKSKMGKVKAKYYILCCGGIENPRLLLSSNDVQKEGIGNQNDLVGRYFQDHIHLHVAKVKPQNKKKFIDQFVTSYNKNIRYSPKIAFTEGFQRKNKILNIAGDIYFKNDGDSALQLLKNIIKGNKRGEMLGTSQSFLNAFTTIIGGFPQIIKAAFQYYILNKAAIDRTGPLYLGVQVEPSPNPLSRVTLIEEKDALGMNKVAVDWQLSDLDKKTIDTYIENLTQSFKDLGVADFEIQKPTNKINFPYDIFDSNHHMGTTRMAQDPKKGVVDETCKVHGIENLYIGSPSVFPTSGFSNPTFNAMALALRMSDQIKEKLEPSKSTRFAE